MQILEELATLSEELGVEGHGSVTVSAKNPSASELRSAKHMQAKGYNIELRDPVNTGLGRTSDLLINGVPYDVYTPRTNSIDRIVSAIAKKGNQATGVVLDLTETNIEAHQLENILTRVQGAGAKQITDIIILSNK